MPSGLGLLDRVATRLSRQFGGPTITVAPPRPIVSFSFDDAPVTALTHGTTVLERHGVRGTFYIAGGMAGREEEGRTILSADGVRELARRGHEIGCHSFAHRSVASLSPWQLADDLDHNAEYLDRAMAGLRARNFAFPYTVASPLARGELNRRFRTSRGGRVGVNRGAVDRAYLKAVEIRSPTDIDALTGWIDHAVVETGWLILFTHDVSPEPTFLGCTPETLAQLVTYAQATGCEVLTVNAALDRIGAP